MGFALRVAIGVLTIVAMAVTAKALFLDGGRPARAPGDGARRVFWTRDMLEPDSVASAWLLERFAVPGCEIRLVPRDGFLDEGTPFDMPLVDLTRNRTESTFHVISDRWHLEDAALAELRRRIDEIEIGGWDRLPSEPARELDEALRTAIAKGASARASLRACYRILDGIYADNGTSRSRRP